MADKKLNEWLVKFLSSNFFIFLILLILLAVSLAAGNVFFKRHFMKKEITNLRVKLEALKKNTQDLEGQVQYYQTSEFLEKEARRKFNMKKEGENVIIVPPK